MYSISILYVLLCIRIHMHIYNPMYQSSESISILFLDNLDCRWGRPINNQIIQIDGPRGRHIFLECHQWLWFIDLFGLCKGVLMTKPGVDSIFSVYSKLKISIALPNFSPRRNKHILYYIVAQYRYLYFDKTYNSSKIAQNIIYSTSKSCLRHWGKRLRAGTKMLIRSARLPTTRAVRWTISVPRPPVTPLGPARLPGPARPSSRGNP